MPERSTKRKLRKMKELVFDKFLNVCKGRVRTMSQPQFDEFIYKITHCRENLTKHNNDLKKDSCKLCGEMLLEDFEQYRGLCHRCIEKERNPS